MSGPERPDAPPIPSGWPELDWVLGTGGFPRGRLVEVFGPEGCGKTSIGLRAAAQAQQAGGAAAYVDADFALDAGRARECGVDLERLVLVRPRSGEEALEIAAALAGSRAVDLVVVDSVAALAPRLELESALEDAPRGTLAELLARGLRRLSAAAGRAGACVLLLNQLRSRPEPASGEGETTAGGPAVRLRASVRVELRPEAGARVRARTVKNRLAPPFRTAAFEIPGAAAGR